MCEGDDLSVASVWSCFLGLNNTVHLDIIALDVVWSVHKAEQAIFFSVSHSEINKRYENPLPEC